MDEVGVQVPVFHLRRLLSLSREEADMLTFKQRTDLVPLIALHDEDNVAGAVPVYEGRIVGVVEAGKDKRPAEALTLNLPMGRFDPAQGDRDLLDTAIRETLQEIGVEYDIGGFQVVGLLGTYFLHRLDIPTEPVVRQKMFIVHLTDLRRCPGDVPPNQDGIVRVTLDLEAEAREGLIPYRTRDIPVMLAHYRAGRGLMAGEGIQPGKAVVHFDVNVS